MSEYHPEHTAAIEELTRQLYACDERTAQLEEALERALRNMPNIAHSLYCPVQQRHSMECVCWVRDAWLLLKRGKGASSTTPIGEVGK